ncbi:carbohydrate ABC transporter permease [Salinibacterium sp. ZJ70]|uniref:carbohydrate ABC transporter permease n=1 Tax=Salinibacterium sp. ZJ70 TaxID=2708084 RepID=UPI00141ECE40|nr:carbohydrate ABC transporter permease [Salinibacterium sp. ZJ70]
MTFVLDAPERSTIPVAVVAPPRGIVRAARFLVRSGPAHAVMIALSLAAVAPLMSLAITAFSPSSVAGGGTAGFTLDNFAYVFATIPMAEMMLDTTIMALAMTVAQLLVALFAAYAFALYEFRGKKLLYLLFVSSWLVPFQVTMIPNYVLVSQLGLLNTIAGVIVPNLCSAFAVIMLRQHVRAIPRELIDAASIDGRGSWATLWLVVVPNLRPALASLAVVLFISAWNDYTWPLIVMQQDPSVVQVGIRSFLGAEGNNWGAIMAASGLACLPVFALYLVLQRRIVDGFVRSGLK